MKALDNFYFQQVEPTKGTLLALKELILAQDPDITGDWKYGMPSPDWSQPSWVIAGHGSPMSGHSGAG